MNQKRKIQVRIKTTETDFICKECNGFGVIDVGPIVEKRAIQGKDYRTIKCKYCDGKGFYDWIENIIGVNR